MTVIASVPRADPQEVEEDFLDLLVMGVAISSACLKLAPHLNLTECLVAQCLGIAYIQDTPLSAYSLEELSGLPRSTVRRALKSLEQKDLVAKTRAGGKTLFSLSRKQASVENRIGFLNEVRSSIRQISRGRNGTFGI